MKPHYTIEFGKLVVRDTSSSSLLWSGDFDGCRVFKILPLGSTEDCLVLLDPGSSTRPTFENLLLVGPAGAVRWKAQLPQTNDAFVDVLLIGQKLEARTWNGLRVKVDVETGQTLEIGFTK